MADAVYICSKTVFPKGCGFVAAVAEWIEQPSGGTIPKCPSCGKLGSSLDDSNCNNLTNLENREAANSLLDAWRSSLHGDVLFSACTTNKVDVAKLSEEQLLEIMDHPDLYI